MRRNLINWLILAGCIIITGCVSGNAVREMRYPGIEPAVAMGSTVRHFVLLISDIDSGSDLLSPRIQKAVRYRSPSPETVISRDNDAEQTKQFWNISIIEDDGDNGQFIVHNAKLSNHTEQENKNDVHLDKLTEQNHSAIPTETNEVSAAEKSNNNEQVAVSKEQNVDNRVASLPNQTEQKKNNAENLDKLNNRKADPPKNENKIKKTEDKKFVPVRKIDEDSLDMTNLKNLKVKEMPQQEQAGITNSQLTLSMAGDQWVLKKMLPQYLELKDRKSTDKQTVFTFDVKSPGEVNLVFVRTTKDAIIRQPYKIFVQDAPNKTAAKTENRSSMPSGSAEAAYKAGMAAKRQSKIEEARKQFTAALEDTENPYYADALTELIGLYKNDNDTAGAAKAYNQYATTDARQSDDKLGILDYDLLVMNGDYKSAITGYRKFMQDFPDSQLTDKALYYLAYSLEHYKVNPDYREAYRIYNIIISRYPESKYHKPSQNRSLYLERHYLKIN